MADNSTQTVVRPKIEYVLFDMDGLMIDSERVYTDVTNRILSPYGKEMTWDIKSGLMGKPEIQAAEHLLSFFPDITLTISSYLEQRNVLQDEMWPKVPLLPGVRKLVLHLKEHNIPMAVATGSRRRNFKLKTGHLGEVFECFEGKIVCADDQQYKMKGKPEPDVFLVAAKEVLGVDVGNPENPANEGQKARRMAGLVFEDSIPGLEAGKRAGMSVVWVPDDNLYNLGYTGEEQPDQTLKSLEDFIPEEWGLPPYTF